MEECPKGSSRLTRSTNDVKQVCEILKKVNSDITKQSICDCVRLGKYSPEKNRPILVKMLQSHEVTSVLANRHSLSGCPKISIKPILTKEQLTIESALLKERWNLIQSGTDSRDIKIKGTRLYVKDTLHGSILNGIFTPSNKLNGTQDNIPFLDQGQEGEMRDP